MKVLYYLENEKILSKSGLGKAVKHQMLACETENIPYTTNPKEDFDIVHINWYGPKSKRFAKKCRKKGIPVVYHAHSTEEDFKNSFIGSNIFSPIFKKIIVSAYNLGDVIITPTNYSKKLLESYGTIKPPIYAISNGVDLSKFKPNKSSREKFLKRYNYKKEDKIIVGIGLYLKRKGILDFVELAKRLPEYKFIWFGYLDLKLVPKEIKDAVNTKLDNLYFAGYVDNSLICEALQSCDLYLFPTLEETEGIPIIEALSAGAPTLVRDIGVFDYLKNDKEVYKAKNIDEFEDKIKKIINKELPDITSQGIKAVHDMDIKEVAKKLKNIYETTLKKNS